MRTRIAATEISRDARLTTFWPIVALCVYRDDDSIGDGNDDDDDEMMMMIVMNRC